MVANFWISTIFLDRGATVLFLRAIMHCHFFHLFSAIFAGPRVLNFRNFVTIATWRNDYPLLTVYKAHISKVYFVVVVLILHVIRLTAVKTTQIEEWATVSVLSFYLQ